VLPRGDIDFRGWIVEESRWEDLLAVMDSLVEPGKPAESGLVGAVDVALDLHGIGVSPQTIEETRLCDRGRWTGVICIFWRAWLRGF